VWLPSQEREFAHGEGDQVWQCAREGEYTRAVKEKVMSVLAGRLLPTREGGIFRTMPISRV
jgi:hypothetical protein